VSAAGIVSNRSVAYTNVQHFDVLPLQDSELLSKLVRRPRSAAT